MAQENHQIIKTYLSEVAATVGMLPVDNIAQVVELIERARARGKRIFTFGNGGSAATASHFASDL
jgi:D-sedoheptulose 7-phosphate isomerase